MSDEIRCKVENTAAQLLFLADGLGMIGKCIGQSDYTINAYNYDKINALGYILEAIAKDFHEKAGSIFDNVNHLKDAT